MSCELPAGSTPNVYRVSSGPADVWCVNVGLCEGWIIVPEKVEGRNFANIDFGRQCTQFLGDRFVMVKHIAELRNRTVLELTAESALHYDPNEPTPLKRELMERIPRIITINVATASGMQASVAVLPSWQVTEMLHIEVTQQNMKLLLEKPAAAAPWLPGMGLPWRPFVVWHAFRRRIAPDVVWHPLHNRITCKWWDSVECCFKETSRLVSIGSIADNEYRQERVTIAARDLQSWFEQHHNLGDDIHLNDDIPPENPEGIRRKRARSSLSRELDWAVDEGLIQLGLRVRQPEASAESAPSEANVYR